MKSTDSLSPWAYKAALRLSQIVNESPEQITMPFAVVKDENGRIWLVISGKAEKLGDVNNIVVT